MLAAAVVALPPAQRVAIVLHHFEGLPSKEIAHITGTAGAALSTTCSGPGGMLTKALADWK